MNTLQIQEYSSISGYNSKRNAAGIVGTLRAASLATSRPLEADDMTTKKHSSQRAGDTSNAIAKNTLDIVGRRAGMLVAVERLSGSNVRCECDCGGERVMKVGHFNSGKLRGCGCQKEVAQLDRVNSMRTTLDGRSLPRKFLSRLVATPTSQCVIWPFGKRSTGYGVVRFQDKSISAHRAALILLTGIDPKGMVAAHGPCHNRLCVNPHPEHGMRWATYAENNLDKWRDGTMPNGSARRNCKDLC